MDAKEETSGLERLGQCPICGWEGRSENGCKNEECRWPYLHRAKIVNIVVPEGY